jgi:hypothetical protein
MKKIINPGSAIMNGRKVKVFCKIEIKDGNLSITGVIGPRKSGTAPSCGQIYGEFIGAEKYDIKLEKGWNNIIWEHFLSVWEKWHLNDLRPACEHQRKLGWKYNEHHDKNTFRGEPCPVCGYEIGSKWLKEELPQHVIDFLNNLEETKVQPAWC